MRIGIDFDNTIACYDNSFFQVALKNKWIENNIPKSKNSVKLYMHEKKLFKEFTTLQGLVYGKEILRAKVFSGFKKFIVENCSKHKFFIISHKTRYPIIGKKIDLHFAAYDFLNHNKLEYFTKDIENRVYLETEKENKIKRAKILDLDYFIDDLPEILNMKGFLTKTKKVLFDPNKISQYDSMFMNFSSWVEINNFFKSR